MKMCIFEGITIMSYVEILNVFYSVHYSKIKEKSVVFLLMYIHDAICSALSVCYP